MEVMISKKQPLSKLAEGFEMYPQVLINVKVSDKPAVKNDPDVMSAVETAEKKLNNSGRILVRESGTEPVIRVMVEAPEYDLCRECAESIVKIIKDKGYATE